jgi:hypothetical protein
MTRNHLLYVLIAAIDQGLSKEELDILSKTARFVAEPGGREAMTTHLNWMTDASATVAGWREMRKDHQALMGLQEQPR